MYVKIYISKYDYEYILEQWKDNTYEPDYIIWIPI